MARTRNVRRKPSEAEIIDSAIVAIEGVLGLPILERHKRAIISGMLWIITEARGKYDTRFKSRGALANTGEKLQHEHVFTRKDLTDRVLAEPARAREILADAIACVVTESEHQRLSAVPRSVRGWDRYHAAGVEYVDCDAAAAEGAHESEGS